MDILHTLQKLGLTKKEAQVYLTLLSLGKVTGYEVAKKSALDRSTTYFLLRSLRAKGLVLQAPHGSKQHFVAKNPQTFIDEKKEVLTSAEAILPQLMKMCHHNHGPQTLHFEGEDCAKESLLYVLDRAATKEVIAFISHTPGGPTKEVVESVNTSHELVMRHGMTFRGVAPYVDEQIYLFRPTDRFAKDIRLLPIEQFNLKSSFLIVDNFVRILTRSRGVSVVIENDEIADIGRDIFATLWPKAIEFKPTMATGKRK